MLLTAPPTPALMVPQQMACRALTGALAATALMAATAPNWSFYPRPAATAEMILPRLVASAAEAATLLSDLAATAAQAAMVDRLMAALEAVVAALAAMAARAATAATWNIHPLPAATAVTPW